jgi:hypothetical protein
VEDIDLWLYDIARDSLVQVTNDGNSRYPKWIDDQRLMFERRGNPSQIFAVALDAAGRPAGAPQALVGVDSIPWFADGETLVYSELDGDNWDLFRTPLSGASKGQPLLERPRSQWGAILSADRNWLAYVSDELASNTFDVFLSPYQPPLRPRRLIPGARGVRWSRSSNELFFLRDGRLFAGKIGADGSLVGEPALVADAMVDSDPGLPPYDTMPDGRLLILVDEPFAADARAPVLVLNWVTRLREADTRR